MNQGKPGISKKLAPGGKSDTNNMKLDPIPASTPDQNQDQDQNETKCYHLSNKNTRMMTNRPLPAPASTFKYTLQMEEDYYDDDEDQQDEGFYVGTGTNEWNQRTKMDAEDIQIEMQLKFASLEFGAGSNEFRELVNARSRGDPIPPPCVPKGVKAPKPELNIAPKLARQLASYTGQELKKDFLKASYNLHKAMKNDDEVAERFANVDLYALSTPIKIKLPEEKVDKMAWNVSDDDDDEINHPFNTDNPFKDE